VDDERNFADGLATTLKRAGYQTNTLFTESHRIVLQLTCSLDVSQKDHPMKTTRYFEEQVLRKRPYLRREWCQLALDEPIYYEIQAEDDRIRHWVFIPELGTYLRVVTLPDGETIHNAFPDPAFKSEG
jgi:hypothetical protein